MERRRKRMRPHPTRSQIVDVMRSYGKPLSPSELADVTGKTLGSVSYHVRTLLTAGIIELAHEGRVRGAVEHFYELVADHDQPLLRDRVDQLLELCKAQTLASDGEFPRPTVIDDDAREALLRLADTITPVVLRIAAASTKRASTS